jgi:hypothetical protein
MRLSGCKDTTPKFYPAIFRFIDKPRDHAGQWNAKRVVKSVVDWNIVLMHVLFDTFNLFAAGDHGPIHTRFLEVESPFCT